MDVTVVVATYGDPSWRQLAETRAVPSVDVPVVQFHGDTLHDARNGGLTQVDTEWVCFLDADDELEAGYFEAMAQGVADVRAPMVRYGSDTNWGHPRVLNVWNHRHVCTAECLSDGNWIVIGALVRTEMVRTVGGWRDFPWSEDWDLWLRCRAAGATFETCHGAVYRAHVRPDSRNRGASRELALAAHVAIAEANGL